MFTSKSIELFYLLFQGMLVFQVLILVIVYCIIRKKEINIYLICKEAVNNASSKGVLGREWEGYDGQGIKWRGYTDKDGAVTSFYPEL